MMDRYRNIIESQIIATYLISKWPKQVFLRMFKSQTMSVLCDSSQTQRKKETSQLL